MVVFRILTHDAYVRLRRQQRLREFVTPGITMHDIRVAIRIEKTWDKYWAQSKARLPQKGWKLTGRRRIAVRYWGILEARLRGDWRREANKARAQVQKKWLKTQGKGLKGKRKTEKNEIETPRWKKMKWKKRARKKKQVQSDVEVQPSL
jgi:hypothetical protein